MWRDVVSPWRCPPREQLAALPHLTEHVIIDLSFVLNLPGGPRVSCLIHQLQGRLMGQFKKGDDWEACGIAQVGVGAGAAGGVYFFDFRSKKADCHAHFILTAAGLGGGGSLGGAVAPSPLDVIKNRVPELFSPLKCLRPFACDDLDWSSGAILSVGAGAMVGYSLAQISAGAVPQLFEHQDVSGWGIGMGATGVSLVGMWTQLGESTNYY
jgi:hypothetical protein